MPSPWQVLTTRGKVVLALGILCSVAAMLIGQVSLMWLGLVLIFATLGSTAFVLVTKPRVNVQRSINPEHTPLGSDIACTLRIDTRLLNSWGGLMLFEERVPPALGPRPRFIINQFGFLPEADGVGTNSISYLIRGKQRGRFRAGPLRVEIRDPFGLAVLHRGQRRASEFLITPTIHDLAAAHLASGAGSTGEASPQRSGVLGEDDVLIREYRHGDDLRRVHWPSTARHGELMVRREEQSWDPSALLLLDSRFSHHVGPGQHSSFEWAVSAAASIAIHLLAIGYRIDVAEAGGQQLSTKITHEPTLARREILEILTDAKLAQQTSLDTLLATAASLHHGQLVVAVTGSLSLIDAQRLSALRGPNTRAIALVIDAGTFVGSAANSETQLATQHLISSGWSALTVPYKMSVPQAWANVIGVAS